MIGTILVPLDGSVDAEGALPQVRRLVTETTGRVVLIRVVPTGPDLGDPPAEHPEAVAEAETYLQQVARGLACDGVPVQVEVFYVDPDDVEAFYEGPAHVIRGAAKAYHADLIAMSTHGRSGVRRLVLGSVAEAVVREAPAPLLLVRGFHGYGRTHAGPYQRILVVLDGSARAERVVRLVAQEAFARGATFILVHTQPEAHTARTNRTSAGDADAMRLHGQAERYLESVAQTYLSARPYRAHVALMEPMAAVLHYAREAEVELMAMPSPSPCRHGHTLGDRASTTVLHHADVPVLLIPDSFTDEERATVRREGAQRARSSCGQ